MKNTVSTTERLIPLRTRRREERDMLRRMADPKNDFSCRYLPRHGAYILVVPHPDESGCYTSTTFDLPAAEKLADFFLRTLPDMEELAQVKRLLDSQQCEHAVKVWRLEDELQVLRWRILLLERDAERRAPAYSDATALVLAKGGAS